MSIFWEQYKEYIITGTIAVFGVVLVWYGILPMHQKIKDQMTKSQELLADREIRDTLVANLSDVREQKDLVEKQEDRLKMVIAKSSIVDLVKDVEALAKETHTVIAIDAKDQSVALASLSKAKTKTDTSSDKGAEKSLLESLPSEHRLGITITLTGGYNDIVRFVQKLESMPYETDILAVSLSVTQSTAPTNQASVNIFSSNTGTLETQQASVAQDTLPLQAVLDTIVYVNED